jgi:hypothetical protein
MKEEIHAGLKELFEDYASRGIRSLYLYGSSTGPDYVPGESDVDSIAIASSTIPIETETEMLEWLKARYPNIRKFGVRILYLEELVERKRKGSNLTFFLYPESLIADAPYWELIAGEEVRAMLPVVSKEETLEAIVGVLDQWHWRDVNSVEQGKFENYLKVLARILWTLDGMQGKTYPFSYSALADRSDKYAPLAKTILEIKRNGWDKNMFEENKVLFQEFVSALPHGSESHTSI